MPESLKPPAINRSKSAVARPDDVVDHYRGEAAGDPYRWLECGTDPETAAWVSAQNELTQAWLATVPTRAAIRSRLGERWNYARFGVPFERGGHWFQARNSGLQAQAVLCVMDAPQDEGRVLIDPNVLSAEGTVALGAISVSPDGSKVAYATAVSGSDWLTWHVRDVASGADEADKRRIVAIDLEHPGRPHWQEVVPEAGDTLLEAHFFGGRLVCHYLRDACSLRRVFELDGTFVRDIPLPAMSTLGGKQLRHELIEGRPGSDIVQFEMVSFTSPAALYRHDLRSGETTLVHAPAGALDRREFITERVSVTLADGTVLPMFLTRRRGMARSGDVPVLVCGYGGVGVSTTPSFSATWAVWLQRGGMLAVACLRGGGEYGRAWHDAGRRAAKQNTFDDFCACARWLASSGWSKAARIAINGGSNGGLLVGACLTQHPELFGAAIADVGVFDMLRFHRFTVGYLWRSEYGDPDDPEECRWLRRYSPLHNVRPAVYPPTLLTTGDHDDRVVPAHSFKFAAALQAAQRGEVPILLRVETSAGHSAAGKPTAKAIAEAADRLAFLDGALGLAPL
jgi:prolyl oligopeptidase PreP (S9A serine peptidase family)